MPVKQIGMSVATKSIEKHNFMLNLEACDGAK